MTEQEQRTAVVAEARTWLRTPYHPMGRIKGAGADCYTLLAEVFRTAGLFTAEEEFYPRDWFLHATEDHYKLRILRHAREMVEHFCSPTEMTGPGNIVLVRIGRKIGDIDAHGGIVAQWPKVIHAYPPCVMEADARYHPAFAGGRLEFYSPWTKKDV
jgi:cell wall-associated NlpC family hydrolase